jgi:hypothetical protein
MIRRAAHQSSFTPKVTIPLFGLSGYGSTMQDDTAASTRVRPHCTSTWQPEPWAAGRTTQGLQSSQPRPSARTPWVKASRTNSLLDEQATRAMRSASRSSIRKPAPARARRRRFSTRSMVVRRRHARGGTPTQRAHTMKNCDIIKAQCKVVTFQLSVAQRCA